MFVFQKDSGIDSLGLPSIAKRAKLMVILPNIVGGVYLFLRIEWMDSCACMSLAFAPDVLVGVCCIICVVVDVDFACFVWLVHPARTSQPASLVHVFRFTRTRFAYALSKISAEGKKKSLAAKQLKTIDRMS